MGYEPDKMYERDYLYGCLLAIADAAEREALDKEDRDKRVTNARRYWNAFSQHPYQIWGIIERNLGVYLIKLEKKQVKYQRWLNEIMNKMEAEDFVDNTRLGNEYLLGYHHFMAYMWNNSAAKKEEN